MRRYIVLGSFALALTSGPEAPHAQMGTPGQPGGSIQLPTMPPAYVSQANICSTQWGWCHLAGHTLFFPMPGGPVSPYLQPHVSGTPAR
jgi:hypothetical protein